MQTWREEVSVDYDKETQRPVQYSVAHECDGGYVGEVAHLLPLLTAFFFYTLTCVVARIYGNV